VARLFQLTNKKVNKVEKQQVIFEKGWGLSAKLFLYTHETLQLKNMN
jgi:hypothetical protein